MRSFFDQLMRSFRIEDAADILLVSIFLYALLLWFKSAASKQILIGIGILAVVYGVALSYDLYMTTAIFQGVLAFAAIAGIVVFQEDLRRVFARIAVLGKMPAGRSTIADANLDVLVEIAFEFAAKRTGALVVLRGRETIDRHVMRGVTVDASISKALLDSIFDPHSMGHDGAVIIDRDRISQFAAHLPLSDNRGEIGSRGTRHSAALGLAELSDAFVIVVSEERGEVSVAEGRALTRVASAVELKKRLDRFAQRVRPKCHAEARRNLLVEHSGLKMLALLAACLGWYVTVFQVETVQKTFVVPIVYRNLPDSMDIDDAAPAEARLTLAGFERAFTMLAPSTLKVTIDLSLVTEGPQQIAINETHINLPDNLELFRSVPRVVSLNAHTWVRTRLPVVLRMVGRLAQPLRAREVLFDPREVHVLIWQSRKAATPNLYSESIDLSQLSDGMEVKAKIVVPEHVRLEINQPMEVSVRLDAAVEKPNPGARGAPDAPK